MEKNSKELVEDFLGFITFVKNLSEMDDQYWHTAIADGKWTIKDIICHIMLWDKYFYEEAISKIRQNVPLTLRHLDYDQFNANAIEYAKTQTKESIFDQFMEYRTKIINDIDGLSEEEYCKPYVDGDENNFSLHEYLIGFVPHDKHHQAQIENVIKRIANHIPSSGEVNMTDTKFEEDWEVSCKIEALTRELLKQGKSPSEVRSMVLKSQEYNEWESIGRCFQICCQEIEYYLDLKSSIEFEQYSDQLDLIAGQVLNNQEISLLEWDVEHDRLFKQIGIVIQPEELAREIGKFSKLMGFETPIKLLEFFSLFTGNASGLFGMEEVRLNELETQMQAIESYTKEFEGRFKGR